MGCDKPAPTIAPLTDMTMQQAFDSVADCPDTGGDDILEANPGEPNFFDCLFESGKCIPEFYPRCLPDGSPHPNAGEPTNHPYAGCEILIHKDGTYYVVDVTADDNFAVVTPESFEGISLVNKTQTGSNPENSINKFDFECRGKLIDTPLTLADARALLNGHTFPGTDDGTGAPIVFDDTNPLHFLHSYDIRLLGQNSDVGVPPVKTTTCQATYVNGPKPAEDMDPGSNMASITQDEGTEVPDFTVTPDAGSGIMYTLCASICQDSKTGDLVDASGKAAAPEGEREEPADG